MVFVIIQFKQTRKNADIQAYIKQFDNGMVEVDFLPETEKLGEEKSWDGTS